MPASVPMSTSRYSTLHMRQSVLLPSQKSHKRMDVGSERFPFHSQRTLPSTTASTATTTSYHSIVVDSNRPCHPGILRSSCSLPVGPSLQRQPSCQVDDVVSRLRMQITSDPSLGIVERRNRIKVLPQFKPNAFVLSSTPSLSGEEIKRLHLLFDITTATVKDPNIFHHLLEGETRILLDPVSQKMPAPAVLGVTWKQQCGDVASQASTSTSTSLNVSLTSMGAIDETENMSVTPSTTIPLCSQMMSQHHHWAQRVRDVVSRQSMYNADVMSGKLITRDTRQSVVTWMSKVIEAMGWPLNSFFTAVHAMDYSLKKMASTVTGRSLSIPDSSVPLLSTACVLVGVSAECEHRQLQKARAFVGQVPHVASVKEIVCKQLAVVAGLDRGTLLHKTPLDFILYYLAAIRYYTQEIEEHRCAEELASRDCSFWDKLFLLSVSVVMDQRRSNNNNSHCVLLPYVLQCGERKKDETQPPSSSSSTSSSSQQHLSFIELVIEGALAISVSCYMEYMHTFIPISRVVAAIMFASFSIIEESFKDLDFCTGFCRRVFALDYATELRPVLTEVMPLVYLHISRQLKGGRSSDKSDVQSDPMTMCNDSTFTTWSNSALLLLEHLEELASFGPSAFPQ